MATKILSQTRYAKLVKDIRRLVDEGRTRAARAASQELIQAYWQIGKRISEEHLPERAGYSQAILSDLSDELGIDVSTLKRCVYFFQAYKSAPRGTFVTWSQYKALLSINDVREREWYEQLVQEESLNRDQLVQAIKNDRYTAFKTPQSKTVSAQTIKRPDEATYVYKAIVERVIDGDTVLVRLDLGFQVWKEQRVRLACLDCPAMDEPGGEEAYHYARDQLARAGSVVVKTNKIDIYGRYVGHVFYSFEEMSGAKVFAQGRYLNEELVSGGMARVV